MFSVAQNGKVLDVSKYNWNEETKVFSSKENNLVLYFSEYSRCTFKTGYYCTFITGACCTFDTGTHCTFDTSSNCTFKTSDNCTFKTGEKCIIVRRDIFEVIQPIANQIIKLNEYEVQGFINIYTEADKADKVTPERYIEPERFENAFKGLDV